VIELPNVVSLKGFLVRRPRSVRRWFYTRPAAPFMTIQPLCPLLSLRPPLCSRRQVRRLEFSTERTKSVQKSVATGWNGLALRTVSERALTLGLPRTRNHRVLTKIHLKASTFSIGGDMTGAASVMGQWR
jgi:hypothetical protein